MEFTDVQSVSIFAERAAAIMMYWCLTTNRNQEFWAQTDIHYNLQTSATQHRVICTEQLAKQRSEGREKGWYHDGMITCLLNSAGQPIIIIWQQQFQYYWASSVLEVPVCQEKNKCFHRHYDRRNKGVFSHPVSHFIHHLLLRLA